ncbi:MAG: DUF2723 domain-containing protein [Candidatus Zixiibacteriota bacterium]
MPGYFQNNSGRSRALAASFAVGAVSFVVYWLTAYRTIAWWDNAEYTAVAVSLGVAHPPGSLLLTILGWLVTRIQWGISDTFVLSLTAAAIASATVGLVFWVGRGAVRALTTSEQNLQVTVSILAAFSMAFAATFWSYATRFSPYILTALMTALIFWAMLKWWDRAEGAGGLRWLFVISLLFGLDFSVHRTNLILLPALAAWVIFRRPRTLISGKAWLYGLSGLAAGLIVHFLIIPIAAANPIINGNDPSTLTRFWEYVSLKQYGGGFLVNLFPRKSSFWSNQLVDYLKAFSENFFFVDGQFSAVGLVPGLLGLAGLVSLWRMGWKLGAGMLVMFLCASLLMVFYLNMPADFFRDFARHYLPSFVIFGVFVVYGAASLTLSLSRKRNVVRWPLTAILVLLIGASSINQLWSRYALMNNSYNRIADESARNYLKGLEPNAVLITSGDADTWLPLCVQIADGYRKDVTVCNVHLLNTSWFVRTLLEREPDFPISLGEAQLAALRPIVWQDSTVLIPPKEGTDSLRVLVEATMYGDHRILMVSEQLLLEIIRENKWERPIYFTFPPRWLEPHVRCEGIVSRLLPAQQAIIDRDILRRNLFETYGYAGYEDESIPLEQPAMSVALNLMRAFVMLAMEDISSGDVEAYRTTLQKMEEILPESRIERPNHVKAFLQQLEGAARPDSNSDAR